MNHHRFRNAIDRQAAPIPEQPAIRPGAFVLCPVEFTSVWGATLYEWAFRQAAAVTRPTPLERDLFACWN
jgi:hypothetical protein